MFQFTGRFSRIHFIVLMMAGMCPCPPAMAAKGPLAVDVVTLKSGRSLRGAILHRQSDGALMMAVSREWLQQSDATEFARQAKRDAELQRDALAETKSRMEQELADPPNAPRMVFFLKQELKRIEDVLAGKAVRETPFLLIDIPATQVARTTPAAVDRQRLALFAWNEKMTGVEMLAAQSLKKQLTDAGVNVDGPVPDLSDQLPARPQSDSEWAARLAIVEYTLGESLDFQGMGDAMVRTGNGQKVDLAAILPKLLTSQVDSLLGDLLEPGLKPKPRNALGPESLRPAIAVAEESHRRGFRVTRLDLNAERMAVSVQIDFVVKQSEHEWRAVWTHVETADGSQARPEAEARITDDPQVKTLLESLKGLGLGGDGAMQQAIRVGAATKSAQQAADARFFEFRDRYVRHLDGPPITLPK